MENFPVEILSAIAEHLSSVSMVRFVFLTSKRFTFLLTSQRGLRKVVLNEKVNTKPQPLKIENLWLRFPLNLLSFQSLESLEIISSRSIDFIEATHHSWPKSLTHLKISNCRFFDPEIVKNGVKFLVQVPLSDIMPNLTSLELPEGLGAHRNEICDLSIWLMTLPPSLTRLQYNKDIGTYISALPSTITDLETIGAKSDLELISPDSKVSIRTLVLNSQWRTVVTSDLVKFTSLTSLTIKNSFPLHFSQSDILQLPHLIHLSLGVVSMDAGTIQSMPHSLTYLKVKWNNARIDDFSLFPPNLRTLDWKQIHNLSDSMANLPSGLTKLNWCLVSENRRTNLFDVNLSLLPPNLIWLRFFPQYPRVSTTEIEKLDQFAALRTLKLCCFHFEEKDLFILPRHLTSLSLLDIPHKAEDDWFSGLPPHLIELKIDQRPGRLSTPFESLLTDHILKFLPKTLTRLAMPEFYITGTHVPDHWASLDDFGVVESISRVMPPGIRYQLLDHVNDRLKVNGTISNPLVKKHGLLLGFVPNLKLRELPTSIATLNIAHCIVDIDTLATKYIRHMTIANPEGKLVLQNSVFGEHTPLNRLETLHMLLSRMIQTHHLSRMMSSSLVELCLPNVDIGQGKTVSPLPPTLKKLTLFSIDQKSIRALLTQSNVVYLTIVYGTKLHTVHFAAMPPSLTKLRLGYSVCKRCALGNEARLSPASADSLLSHSSILALPSALTQLEMDHTFGIHCEDLESLPKGLKILAPKFVHASLSDLPLDGIKTLVLPDMIDELVQSAAPPQLKIKKAKTSVHVSDHDTEVLTPSLTALVIRNHYPSIGESFLATLPSGITMLHMPAQLNFGAKALTLLPPTLTHVAILIKGFKSASFQLIPSTIQHLELFGNLGNCANASLLHASQLHALILHKPTCINNQFFTQLPPKLTKIVLGQAEAITKEVVDFIPNSLTHLELFLCPAKLDQSMMPATMKHFSCRL